MKKLLVFLVVVAAALAAFTTSYNENTIIVYSCMEQFRNEELQKQLRDQFPDLNVYVMYMPTAKAAAKLSIEGLDTDADMIVNLESAYMEKVDQYMADSHGYSHLTYLPDTDTAGKNYTTWDRQSGSVIINKTILEKNHLPIPQTYEDLLDPVYKNLIAMPDPKSSGTGYFFLLSLINSMGEDEAFAYIDALSENIKQFTESGSGPIKLLIQGEIAIGLGLTFQGVNEINNGNDFMLLEPEFGCPYSLTTAGLLAGRENNPDIVRVYEYVVNDFMVYDKTYFSPEAVLVDQKNEIAHYPVDIRYADMTGIDDIELKERLLDKWKY